MNTFYYYDDRTGHCVSWDLDEAGVTYEMLKFWFREDIQEWVVLHLVGDESNDMDRWK